MSVSYVPGPVLRGGLGARRNAPLEFLNHIERDVWFLDFNSVLDTSYAVSAPPAGGVAQMEWVQANIGSPTAPLFDHVHEIDTFIDGSWARLNPGTAAAGSGIFLESWAGIMPNQSRVFDFGFYARYRAVVRASVNTFVGMVRTSSPVVAAAGTFSTGIPCMGFYSDLVGNFQFKLSNTGTTISTTVYTNLANGQVVEVELRGKLITDAAGLVTGGFVEAYVDNVLVRTVVIGSTEMSSINMSAGAWAPALHAVRPAGSASNLEIDAIGRWFTRN